MLRSNLNEILVFMAVVDEGSFVDFLVAGDLAAGRLQQVLPALEFGDVNIVTIYPTKRLLEPRVRRFIDLMVEELGR